MIFTSFARAILTLPDLQAAGMLAPDGRCKTVSAVDEHGKAMKARHAWLISKRLVLSNPACLEQQPCITSMAKHVFQASSASQIKYSRPFVALI